MLLLQATTTMLHITHTADGNPTLYSEKFASHYHSLHGSVAESNYIFIEHNLHYYITKHQPASLIMFELGFGTGLNAYLAAEYAHKHSIPITYHTIELYPVANDIIEQLHFNISDVQLYKHLHTAPWEKEIQLTPYFTLHKHEGDFCNYDMIPNHYHLFFMDAFGPDHQPEMWEPIILQKIYDSLLPTGVLTTFSARGSFRRSLQKLGFEVERLPGPEGKRHITRAVKIVSSI